MIIEFRKLNNINDVEFVYELYRSADEPDAPQVPFQSLDEDIKEKIAERSKKISELVLVDNEVVGSVTVVEIKEGLNLGGVLLEKHRGKGLGIKMFQEKAKELKLKCPDKTIYGSTRKDNHVAIGAIKKAGFVFEGEETKPPLGKYKESIVYVRYRF